MWEKQEWTVNIGHMQDDQVLLRFSNNFHTNIDLEHPGHDVKWKEFPKNIRRMCILALNYLCLLSGEEKVLDKSDANIYLIYLTIRIRSYCLGNLRKI